MVKLILKNFKSLVVFQLSLPFTIKNTEIQIQALTSRFHFAIFTMFRFERAIIHRFYEMAQMRSLKTLLASEIFVQLQYIRNINAD